MCADNPDCSIIYILLVFYPKHDILTRNFKLNICALPEPVGALKLSKSQQYEENFLRWEVLMKCLVIFLSLIALVLGSAAYGQTCDPGAQPYVNAMLENEAGYTDFTADMTRVYQYCVLGTEPYASAVAGTYTKKGRDMVRIHETAELPAFNRTIYVLGSCVSEVFETGEVRRDDVAFDIAVVSDPANYDCLLEGLDGTQGIVYFTPKSGSPPEAIVSGIRRWIEGSNGVVTRSEVYTPSGDSASVTESTIIEQVGGPTGPWAAIAADSFPGPAIPG